VLLPSTPPLFNLRSQIAAFPLFLFSVSLSSYLFSMASRLPTSPSSPLEPPSPTRVPQRLHPPLLFLLLLLSLLLPACTRIDHRPDLARAESLVHSSTARWRPDWNAPWSADDLADWDPSTTPLTEHLAVTLALRDNPAIRADLETIAAARADLVQSRLLPNPVLSAAFGIPIAGTDGGTHITLGAMQHLTSLWLRPHRSAAADAALREAILRVSDNALRLVADARAAHARALAAERALLIQRELAEIAAEQLALVRAAADAGEASLADLAAAEIALAQAQRDALDREHALAAARLALLARIGRADAPDAFTLAPPSSHHHEDPPAPSVPPDEHAIIALATTQRLDVAAALAARDGASARLREAGLAPLPDLAVGPMYEREMHGEKMLGPSVSIEIPIFDDGSAAKARAAADARRADLLARRTLQNAVQEARDAYHAHQHAAAAAAIARRRILPAAARSLALAQSAYDAGEASLADLLAARRDHAAATLTTIDADLAATLALIELERSVGGRLD